MTDNQRKILTNRLNIIKGEEETVLVASFDGGNDSGYIQLEDEIEDLKFFKTFTSTDFKEWLVDRLGYGSWAGEFQAQGEIYWNGQEFFITGTESYYEYSDISKENFNL